MAKLEVWTNIGDSDVMDNDVYFITDVDAYPELVSYLTLVADEFVRDGSIWTGYEGDYHKRGDLGYVVSVEVMLRIVDRYCVPVECYRKEGVEVVLARLRSSVVSAY